MPSAPAGAEAGSARAAANQWRVPDLRVAEFLESMQLEQGASAHTLDAYRRDLARLVAWLEENGLDPDRVHGDELVPYASHLAGAVGLGPASVRRHLASARSFLRYRMLVGARTQGVREVPLPKITRDVPRSLEIDEVERLLAVPDASPLGLRDRAAMELLYGAGLRVSELVGLRLQDLDLVERLVRVTGKGSKQRIVPTGSVAAEAMTRYLARGRAFLGRTQLPGALILNANGGRLTRQGAFELVRRNARTAGLPPHVGPHTLRHAFATHLVAGGCDLRTVQELLGHSRIATTQIYTHLAGTHLRETFEAAHPRARVSQTHIRASVVEAGVNPR